MSSFSAAHLWCRNQRANDLNLLATEETLMDLGDIIGGFISYPISQVTKETVNNKRKEEK
ncbi:hypothetical protein [Clostridium gasigenes]|uniref:hypothetical protein n=1 Tax=Clostridium gasigenes TaxID=94869 RepID=UPI001C0BB79D|nr:hypothetical protein [Clostridium gasigenes]MBU3106952.1 hypothetical protein [Clostridium gasigenes]